MHSKKILFAILLTLTSCSLKVNEDPLQPNTISATSAKQGCLNNSGQTIEKFMSGGSDENELNQFYDCLDASFVMFANNTQGKDRDSYKPEELSTFMTKYFLKGKPIPESFLAQAMRLKQVVVGGRLDSITRDELRETVEFFRVLRSASLKVRVAMPLTPKTIEQGISESELNNRIEIFEESLKELATFFKGHSRAYKVDELVRLLQETNSFLYPDKTKTTWIDSFLAYKDLVGPLKSALIAPPENEFSDSDWDHFFDSAPRFYTLFLRLKFYNKSKFDLKQSQGISALNKIIYEGIGMLESSVASHPDQKISKQEVLSIVRAINEAKIYQNQEGLENLIKVATSKIFVDKPSAEFEITATTLQQIKRHMDYFAEGQRILEGLFKAQLGDNYLNGQLNKKDLEKFTATELMQFASDQNLNAKDAAEDILKTIKNVKTSFYNNSHMVYVDTIGESNLQFGYLDLFYKHALTTVNNILVHGYSLNKVTVNEEEISAFLKDLSPLMASYNINAEDLQNMLHSRIFEASLFLPSSEGLESLQYNAMVEFESLLISTLSRYKKIHEYIVQACGIKANDPTQTVNKDCYRKVFAEQAPKMWNFVPGLAEHMASLKQADRVAIIEKIDTCVRKNRTDKNYTLSDTKGMVLMPYYIELLFWRFDKNRDGLLNEKEAKNAYPVFRPFLAEKAIKKGFTDPADHYKIYTYILKFHTVPLTWTEKAKFLIHNADAPFTANRSDIVSIFSALLSL